MNVQRFYRPDDGVPGGHRYRDFDTGFLVKGYDLPNLKKEAKKHRLANNLPIPENFEAMVETQLCEQMPPGRCYFVSGSGPQKLCEVKQDSILAGAAAIVSLVTQWLLGGDVFVSQEEANRRADICCRCPKNTGVHGCTSCGVLKAAKEMLGGITGNRTTPLDDRLHACCLCGCLLKTIVHIRLDILHKGFTDEQRALSPSHCWKLEP